MIVKLLTEHNLEFLRLKGDSRGASVSTLVKMSNCWKSHAVAQLISGHNQPKRVKFTNCSQFLSHICFGLGFHLYVFFLLIGIGQLDNDV